MLRIVQTPIGCRLAPINRWGGFRRCQSCEYARKKSIRSLPIHLCIKFVVDDVLLLSYMGVLPFWKNSLEILPYHSVSLHRLDFIQNALPGRSKPRFVTWSAAVGC